MKESTVEHVQNVLRKRIISGNVAPNEFFRQQAIAEEFGISRTPAREALKALENEGLLVNIPNKGYMVVQLTLKDVLENIDVRKLIEGYAARLVAILNDSEVNAELRSLANKIDERIETYYKTKDKDDFLLLADVHQEFHKKIIMSCGNSLIIQIFTTMKIHPVSTKENFLWWRRVNVPGHQEIVDAIEKGDMDNAEHVAQQHLDYKKENLVGHLGPTAVC